MTPQQSERLESIRARQAHRSATGYLPDRAVDRTSLVDILLDDIDFLLDLLDSHPNEVEEPAALHSRSERADIDSFWLALERSWVIEPRSYFEENAPKNGFGSPLAMAVHYMWKREVKAATPESALQAAKKIVDYIALPDGCEPDDSTGSPTEYIASIITRHFPAVTEDDRDVVGKILVKHVPFPIQLPFGLRGLRDDMLTAIATVRQSAITTERAKWTAAIKPNYCSSTNPQRIMEMHDRAVQQAERQRIQDSSSDVGRQSYGNG